MVMSWSEEQKQAVVALLREGGDIAEVAKTQRIPLEHVLRWAKAAGLLGRKRKAGGGRKPVMDAAGQKVLAELIEANRRMTLDELTAAFVERTGKAVSKVTLGKSMKVMGYKKIRLQKAPCKPAPQSSPRYSAEHRRQGSATAYPSSLTDREWEVLAPLLANKTSRGRPATNDKRALTNAVFYQVRTGNQWRYMPKDLPKWPAVWSFFRRLRDSGTLECMYDALHQLWREAAGRNEAPTAGIVDSQTAKSTEKGGLAATTPARRSGAASAIWSLTQKDSPAPS